MFVPPFQDIDIAECINYLCAGPFLSDGIDMVQSNDLELVQNPSNFRSIFVDKDCELTTLLVTHGLTYRRGCVYYEFARERENISEDKKIILRDEVNVCCKCVQCM